MFIVVGCHSEIIDFIRLSLIFEYGYKNSFIPWGLIIRTDMHNNIIIRYVSICLFDFLVEVKLNNFIFILDIIKNIKHNI